MKKFEAIEVMTPDKYAAIDGYDDMCEFHEVYDSDFHGTVVEFYVDKESAVAGCKYVDGTYGIFGAGMDEDDITYEEMVDGIEYGRE